MSKAYRVVEVFGDYLVQYTAQPGDKLGNGEPMPQRDDWFVADCGGDDGAKARAQHVADALNAYEKPLPVRE